MEEEIDLKPYLAGFLHYWYLFVIAAVLGAGLAYAVSGLLAPTYRATALVAVTSPQETVQFEPSILSNEELQPFKVYPELATSDALIEALYNELTAADLADVASPGQLKGMLSAQSGNDPSIVRLIVRHDDQAATAVLANTWASLFVAWANELYGGNSGEQIAFFEEQLADAAAVLDDAEQAQIAFAARNRSGLLAQQINALESLSKSYLDEQQGALVLIQRIADMQALITASAGSEPTYADALTTLLLQVQAYDRGAESAIQLQLPTAETFLNSTRADQLTQLENLATVLDERVNALDDDLSVLEPEILQLQQEQAELAVEQSSLNRATTLAEETYLALARKVEEQRLAGQEIGNSVRLASQASTPGAPISPQRRLMALIGGVIGLVLAAIVVLVLVARKQSRPASNASTPTARPSTD